MTDASSVSTVLNDFDLLLIAATRKLLQVAAIACVVRKLIGFFRLLVAFLGYGGC